MNHPANKNAPKQSQSQSQSQSQKELPGPVAPGAASVMPDAPGAEGQLSGGRRSMHEIFRESVRVYFLPVTTAVRIGRQLVRLGWAWLRGR